MADPIVNAYFLVPTLPRTCSYSAQDDAEHRLKAIQLKANEAVVIDFVLDWAGEFAFSEVQFGFAGKREDKPQVLKYTNSFILFGKYREVDPANPATDTKDYVDVNYTYHLVKDKKTSPGMVQSYGFTVKTNQPGTYKLKIEFVASEALCLEDLVVTVA